MKNQNKHDLVYPSSQYYSTWEPETSWNLPGLRSVIKTPAFFICIKEGFWKEPWRIESLNSHSKHPGALCSVGVIRASDNNKVVAYFISSPDGLTSHAPCKPIDDCLDEFTIVRYGYTRTSEQTFIAGIILTGEHRDYDDTLVAWDDLEESLFMSAHM